MFISRIIFKLPLKRSLFEQRHSNSDSDTPKALHEHFIWCTLNFSTKKKKTQSTRTRISDMVYLPEARRVLYITQEHEYLTWYTFRRHVVYSKLHKNTNI